MRKLLSSGLVLAGVVSLPVGVSPRQSETPPVPESRKDPRLETLRSFFQKADCPAVQYSSEFLEAADDNDLDWRLLPSISYVESTGGKSAPHNNLFGWNSGRAHFSSPVESIHAVGYRLAHSDLYKDKNLDAMLATYNHAAEYAEKVKSVMQRIAPVE